MATALTSKHWSDEQLLSLPDYAGKVIDALISQKVKVLWKEKDAATEVIITE